MIQAADFQKECLKKGFNFLTGVPCSYLKPLINFVMRDSSCRFVMAAQEGEAVGIACGAALAGQRPVVMCQNSGLGNMINPLTSLVLPYKIPMMLIMTLRGDDHDAPQHSLMGKMTTRFLDDLEIPWEDFPAREEDVAPAVERCASFLKDKSKPYAFIMKKGSLTPGQENNDRNRVSERLSLGENGLHTQNREEIQMSTREAVRHVSSRVEPKDAVISTTGWISRSLHAICDRDLNFYMTGSMGCASAIGLGLALNSPERQVFVLDGDGAVFMKMGNLATLGYYHPQNLCHIVLDNGVHASTGGQATFSSDIDLSRVARACGYPFVREVCSSKELIAALAATRVKKTLSFIHVRTLKDKQPDPRSPFALEEIKTRFEKALNYENR